jgi:hypothetical protein
MLRTTSFGTKHEQINYNDTNAKCRHLKNLPVKRLRGRFLSVWSEAPFSPIPPPRTLHIVYVPYIGTVYLFTQGRGNS